MDYRNLFHTGEAPDTKDRGTGWDIIRPAKDFKWLSVCFVSHTWFPCRIHHYKRATIACRKVGCPACANHELSRWRAYALGVAHQSHRHVILEMSAEVEHTLAEIFKEHGTLRGTSVVFGRTAKRSNAKHLLTRIGKIADPRLIPEDRDVWPLIARIFGIEIDAVPTEGSFSDADKSTLFREEELDGQKGFPLDYEPDARCLAETVAERLAMPPDMKIGQVNGNGRGGRQ